MLEIRHVPTQLILFAIQQWETCGKYCKRAAHGNSVNLFIKGISVWLILKNETTSGCIHSYRQQLKELAKKCKMSVRTLEKYINWLRNEGLCFVSDTGGDLMLHQYGVLRKYDIDIKERESIIFYDTNDKITLAERLVAIGIQRLQDKRCIAYWKKLNANQDELTLLSDLLAEHGADKTKLNDDKEYFRKCHLELLCQSFEEEEPGLESFSLLHKVIKANPDLNAKDATYGTRFGYTIQKQINKRRKKEEFSCSGFNALKQRLFKKQLIALETDHIEGWQRARKDENIFYISWLKKFQHTIWFRPNLLTVNLPKIFKPEKNEKSAA